MIGRHYPKDLLLKRMKENIYISLALAYCLVVGLMTKFDSIL
jgi:hypothetical protein